ncbi:metallophosphoesterase [Aeoliella sp. ICT_H6.2]|uniref:Metallophosphoesterase n=1 Tax=Aeoliella straminimaris TaxID=2954799 RepID=A0A9X2FDN0_9BACT|nr:metallophosphoesterase [Aeoliella straminimaris]MCO6046704.1 metallophosphoesterase [Aeoliella straminimaris]
MASKDHYTRPGLSEGRSWTRRRVLGLATVPVLSMVWPAVSRAAAEQLKRPVRIGLIADLHQDIMHDGPQRMQAFAQAMKGQQLDAVMQLGDFAYPNAKNRAVIDMFNSVHKKALHVIGNHDTDAGHTKQQCLDIWKMPARYYTTNVGGVDLIVLDGNDKGSPKHKGGYPSYVGDEQLQWLEQQLTKLAGPIVVVSHQPLAGAAAVDNAESIQKILSAAADKVILAINGHTHIDDQLTIGHIPYLHVNSASYYWVGGDYQHNSFADEVHAAHKYIEYTCPYREALFAVLSIDPETLTINVTGRKSEWVGQSPKAAGVPDRENQVNGEEIVPVIRDRKVERAEGQT